MFGGDKSLFASVVRCLWKAQIALFYVYVMYIGWNFPTLFCPTLAQNIPPHR